MMLPEIFAVGTGVATFFQKKEESDRMRKVKRDTIAQLEDLKIDSNEMTSRMDMVSDMFNSAIMNDLNQTAIGNAMSGKLNPTTYSQLIPKKQEALVNERRAIDDRNVTIGQKISELTLMDVPKPGVFDFLEGGIQGYGIGVQLDSIINEGERQNKFLELFKDELNKGKTKPSISNFGSTNRAFR